MKTIFFPVLLIVMLINGCDSEHNEMLEPFESIPKSEEIVEANNYFAFSIFKEIALNENEENFMISPFSASLALGMVYNGAENNTANAFDDIFHYGNVSKEEVNEVNKNLIDHLTTTGSGSTFDIANSIWIRNTFPVKEDFIELNKDYYYAKVEKLDFSDPKSIEIINNWVSNNTNQKIPTIIESIPSEMVMYLINALYFKSDWKYQFEAEKNLELPFYPEGQSAVDVTMMSMKNNIGYYSNELFSSVKLPYKDDKFVMTLLLPHQDKAIDDIILQVNQDTWKQWQQFYAEKEVILKIPKFTFSYKKNFNEALTNLGLGVAFTSNADFNSISDVDTHISFVIQKTFIDVNEKGTEAAAATAVGIGVTSLPSTTEITFNRPFLFTITERNTNSICFIGKVGLPKYN